MPTKTKELVLNEPLFDEVKVQIRLAPERLEMRSFFSYTDKEGRNYGEFELLADNQRKCHLLMELENPSCQTTGCIAGWALALTKAKIPKKPDRSAGVLIFQTACKKLGITTNQGERLVNFRCWPARLAEAYVHAKEEGNHKKKAAVTCKAIDWFVEAVKSGEL